MLEGLPPNGAATLVRLSTDEKTARRIADIVSETFDPAETAVAAFEAADGTLNPPWSVEVYVGDTCDVNAVADVVRSAANGGEIIIEAVAQQDWVAAALEGLKPVDAGPFAIHGSHDRGRIGPNRIGIEIEAALAFGTGHHGTTRGCLLALARWAQSARYGTPRILDVGTGTGVLAIAAARLLHMPVLASDIDRIAVDTARDNAKLNRAGSALRLVHAPGVDAGIFRQGGKFDLVMANILARPLVRLSRPLAALVAPGGTLVLSGLLHAQAPMVTNAYRAQGLRLVNRQQIDEWTTLTLRA